MFLFSPSIFFLKRQSEPNRLVGSEPRLDGLLLIEPRATLICYAGGSPAGLQTTRCSIKKQTLLSPHIAKAAIPNAGYKSLPPSISDRSGVCGHRAPRAPGRAPSNSAVTTVSPPGRNLATMTFPVNVRCAPVN